MSRKKKIYADQDPYWGGRNMKYWKGFFPRWWNPLFWMAVIAFPLIAAITAFTVGIYELTCEIWTFFHKYKI